ncbi:MAG TPA: DUF998 domain-containing protein [Candidatus Saccharimonadales bacterium]|nr:DUF998 domain-containing protein [Candidatus Saccharimonadales bacterium]
MNKIAIMESKRRTLWWLGIVAGLLYISWPLGYWLNPAVSKNSLASGLEAVGQPYNWLFIGADVASGLLVIALSWSFWRALKGRSPLQAMHITLVSAALFGIGTIADALLPEQCIPGFEQCPSFTHSHILLVHGFFSILASIFLFVSLCIMWAHQRRSVLLNGLLLGYILFGVVSLIEAVFPAGNGNWSQHYYITLCGIWIMAIPYAVEQYAYKLAAAQNA